MEEDNADDIVKWLFKESTKLDCRGQVKVTHGEDSNSRHHAKLWKARLRGNLLGLSSLDFASEPLLIVCEKINVERSDAHQNSLIIKQHNKETMLTFGSEKECDEWMLKLMTCSHRIIQAEYEQVLFKRFTQPLPTTSQSEEKSSHELDYFLTSPYSREQVFSLSQSLNLPTRQIKCRETMYETKLSLLIPQEMLRHSLKWAMELRDELLDKLWGLKNEVILESLHTAVRHLNSNIEICTQACEFLDSHTGPSFRPSTEKFRVSFLYVPTNLHVQSFCINAKLSSTYVTVGALAALPLRFSSGGFYKIRNKFSTAMGPVALDHTNEARFHVRRQALAGMKRKIGDLSRRIDTEWRLIDEAKTDKIGIEIFAEIKQLYEQVTDMVSSFPNISNFVNAMCDGGLAMMQRKNEEAVPRDTLCSQLDYLQAQFVLMNSKMAAIDRMEGQDQQSRKSCEENTRLAVHSTLDALHHLAASLASAQMLSLVQCFRKQSDCQTFFHLQLRHDALLSMTVTLVVCSLLTALYNSTIDVATFWEHCPPLITCFSFLSCYGDEHGMLEDTVEIWQQFPSIVCFRFVKINSSVSQNCIPQIDGFRTNLHVSIPIHSDQMKKLPKHLADGDWFHPRVIFWNLGINHEASLAASIGDLSFEEEINRTALRQTVEHTLLLTSTVEGHSCENVGLIEQSLAELQQTVASCPSRKNVSIFTHAMSLNSAIGGIPVISCKSGKDRTSMAVTLEEGRILRETCGISNQQMNEMVESLRRSGVRRENCRKNTGKPLYSFSPFQLGFLPTPLRPPFGTFTNMVAS